jgi:hypothetical protein
MADKNFDLTNYFFKDDSKFAAFAFSIAVLAVIFNQWVTVVSLAIAGIWIAKRGI